MRCYWSSWIFLLLTSGRCRVFCNGNDGSRKSSYLTVLLLRVICLCKGARDVIGHERNYPTDTWNDPRPTFPLWLVLLLLLLL